MPWHGSQMPLHGLQIIYKLGQNAGICLSLLLLIPRYSKPWITWIQRDRPILYDLCKNTTYAHTTIMLSQLYFVLLVFSMGLQVITIYDYHSTITIIHNCFTHDISVLGNVAQSSCILHFAETVNSRHYQSKRDT